MTELIKKRAERLNQAIQKSGLSYAELETLTGVAKSSIQRYATGRTQKIPIENIELLAVALHVTPQYLLLWDEPEQKSTPAVSKSAMPEILKVFSSSEVDKLSSLSRDQAAEVVKLVDDFLSEK